MTRRDARLVCNPPLGLPAMHEQAGALATILAVQARLSALLQRGHQADRWRHQHQGSTSAYLQAVAASARQIVGSCPARQQRQGEQREEVEP